MSDPKCLALASGRVGLTFAALSCFGSLSYLTDCPFYWGYVTTPPHPALNRFQLFVVQTLRLTDWLTDWLTGKYRVENFRFEAKVWFKKMSDVMLSFSLIMLTAPWYFYWQHYRLIERRCQCSTGGSPCGQLCSVGVNSSQLPDEDWSGVWKSC